MEHLFFPISFGVAFLPMIILSCVLLIKGWNIMGLKALWPLRIVALVTTLLVASIALIFLANIFILLPTSPIVCYSVLLIFLMGSASFIAAIYKVFGIMHSIIKLNSCHFVGRDEDPRSQLYYADVRISYRSNCRYFMIFSSISYVLFGIMILIVIFMS